MDVLTAGTIGAVLVPVLLWVDSRLRALERGVASLDAKVGMLLTGHKVVNDGANLQAPVGSAPRARRS